MRKQKQSSPFMPFWAGLVCGYIVTLLICVLAAVVLSFTDAAEKGSSAAAIPAIAVGSYVCGRTAGVLRRRNGLKTGALCGVLFMIPLVVLSLIFGLTGSIMLFLKIALCVIFGTIGGVAGVNTDKKF